jgi:hypothetical protein
MTVIANPDNDLFFSLTSNLEIKIQLKKLELIATKVI